MTFTAPYTPSRQQGSSSDPEVTDRICGHGLPPMGVKKLLLLVEMARHASGDGAPVPDWPPADCWAPHGTQWHVVCVLPVLACGLRSKDCGACFRVPGGRSGCALELCSWPFCICACCPSPRSILWWVRLARKLLVCTKSAKMVERDGTVKETPGVPPEPPCEVRADAFIGCLRDAGLEA